MDFIAVTMSSKQEAMATAKPSRNLRNRLWPKLALGIALILGVSVWFYRTPIYRDAELATAYGARVGCACRYIGGREIGDCERDFEPGMEVVFLSENSRDKSVTATIPLVSSATASWSEGPGCVLEKWDG
jgi:hypothetical protein